MAIRPVSPTPEFRLGRDMDLLTPHMLSSFLSSQDGWTLHSRRSFDETWALDFARGTRSAVVHIPTDPDDVDYKRRLVEAIEEIATATRTSVDSLTSDILSARMDRISIRELSPSDQVLSNPTRGAGLNQLQSLMTFFAQIAENSEAGRRIKQAAGENPSEAATADWVVIELAPRLVVALPASDPRAASPRDASAENGQGEQVDVKSNHRELTLTAFRTLKLVQEDTSHGTAIDLWAPIDNEDDRRRRSAVVRLLKATLERRTEMANSISVDFAWHKEGPGQTVDISEVQFGPEEIRYLDLARQRYR